MAVKALASGHAELAAHPAACLRRYAECRSVSVRNHDSLDRTGLKVFLRDMKINPPSMAALDRKKVLLGSVRRNLESGIWHYTDLIFLGKLCPCRLREVCHVIYGTYLLHIKPLGDLLGCKARQTFLGNEFLQFVKILS